MRVFEPINQKTLMHKFQFFPFLQIFRGTTTKQPSGKSRSSNWGEFHLHTV